MKIALGSVLLLLLIRFPGAGALADPPLPADLVLLNGQIVTMDRSRPEVQALAIHGDRIAWTGTTEDAQKIFTAVGRTLDLQGATVLPGIIDAHTHLMALGESYLHLNLKDVSSENEIIERVKRKAASAKPNEWIQGWGWDEGKWASHYPTNQALSEVSPNNPVVLVGLHSFAAWANQKALQIAGINKNTKDPEHGKILHDEKTGEPTGVLLNTAQQLVEKKIPPLTLEQVKAALALAADECLRDGLTSVHEAKVSPIMIQAFRELIVEGRLPLRVYAMLDGGDRALVMEWLERGPEIDRHHHLSIRAFKLFADGALGSRGAALLEPYSDASQTTGVITTPEAEVRELTERSLEKGFQVCTHAIGDAANRMVLNAYENALKKVPQAHDPRLRIEHAQVLAPDDIPRFAKLGVIPSMQPVHCTSDMAWAEKRLGPERIKGAYAWRSLLATGVHLPLSSDFPGVTLNPFYGIHAAVSRQDPEGNPSGGWYPAQRLSLEEALRGYTVEAAYAEFEEADKGSIEKGKLADFIVISKDIRKVAAKEMLSIRVLQTFTGGKLVYEAR
jgi:predicted amidohydrolase YtcJ